MKCPNCGSEWMSLDTDGYEDYLTCGICGRQLELDGSFRKPSDLPYINNKEGWRDEKMSDI